jgi:ribonuclease PH
MTGSGHFVEVQASAEGRPYTDVELQDLMKLAAGGIRQLIRVQTELLHLKFLPRSK